MREVGLEVRAECGPREGEGREMGKGTLPTPNVIVGCFLKTELVLGEATIAIKPWDVWNRLLVVLVRPGWWPPRGASGKTLKGESYAHMPGSTHGGHSLQHRTRL